MTHDAPIELILSNQLRLKNLPEDLREELIQKLTLVNPKWVENERMGRWNRNTPNTLRFFRRAGQGGLIIPRGYIRRLISGLNEMDQPWKLTDKRRELPAVDFSFSGTLRPFQEIATNAMLAKAFGTLCAPTGSGKTVMALYIIAQRRQPAVIVVHTKELAFQWVNQIGAFLKIPEKQVGIIGAGKQRMGDKITVCLVQSLYKQAETVSKGCGFIIVDECHRTPSRTFTEALTAFDAKYMLGLSATPWRRDRLSKLIFWHLGDVHHEIEKSILVESGDVLSAEVIVRNTDFKPFHDPTKEYSKMLTELTANDARNRLIAEDVAKEAASSKGVCLVLTDRKHHGETLNALLKYKHKIKSALLTGDLSTQQRKAVLDDLNKGAVKVLVATGQLVGEGFDSKHLTTLFLATPIRFSGRVLQYLGRVLRPAPNKEKARVFDYVDVQVPVLVKAAQERRRVYDR
ncbi:MAG: DEAD/DEAH box helicase family protein [Deltaproteobacteria bacterium]|nr:DEAD/DEAH box helicase family protein [Deltaproteobacteria bacterium]